MNISQKYLSILDDLTPYIFSYSENLKEFNLNALGKEINYFSPQDESSLKFFEKLKILDQKSFGGSGMGMDNWVFLDCAIMPGAIFGFAIHSKFAPLEILTDYNIDNDYDGLIPLSMFIAIPMANKESWFAHNLSSSNSFSKHKVSGLGLLTKAMGLIVLQIKKLHGATQWDNSSLHVHTKLAKLRVESAFTPIHTHPMSILYSCNISPESIEDSLRETKKIVSNFVLDITDKKSIFELDKKIKADKKVYLLSAAIDNKVQLEII